MLEQRGLFDLDERYQRLSEAGDLPEKRSALIDFERFRADLDAAIDYKSGTQGSCRPMDVMVVFKVLVLQAFYNLSNP